MPVTAVELMKFGMPAILAQRVVSQIDAQESDVFALMRATCTESRSVVNRSHVYRTKCMGTGRSAHSRAIPHHGSIDPRPIFGHSSVTLVTPLRNGSIPHRTSHGMPPTYRGPFAVVRRRLLR